MDFSQINYLAVLVAALSTLILGGLWYSPMLLGKVWMRANNFTDADLQTHHVAASGSSDEAGAHVRIFFVERADVARVFVVVDDFFAVGHEVLRMCNLWAAGPLETRRRGGTGPSDGPHQFSALSRRSTWG